jgi:hypothetical protein
LRGGGGACKLQLPDRGGRQSYLLLLSCFPFPKKMWNDALWHVMNLCLRGGRRLCDGRWTRCREWPKLAGFFNGLFVFYILLKTLMDVHYHS